MALRCFNSPCWPGVQSILHASNFLLSKSPVGQLVFARVESTVLRCGYQSKLRATSPKTIPSCSVRSTMDDFHPPIVVVVSFKALEAIGTIIVVQHDKYNKRYIHTNNSYLPHFVLVLFIVGYRANIVRMKTSMRFCVQKTDDIAIFHEFRGWKVGCIHFFNDPIILLVHVRVDGNLLLCSNKMLSVHVHIKQHASTALTFASARVLMVMRMQVATAIGQVIHGDFGAIQDVCNSV